MDNKVIESFIPAYPDTSDPNFEYNLTRKKEFYDLKLDVSENAPDPGQLLQSQLFMKRFFSENTPYDKALLFQGLGTGKCIHPDSLVETTKGKIKAEAIWKRYHGIIYKDETNSKSHPDCFTQNDIESEYWSIPAEDIFVYSVHQITEKIIKTKIARLFRQNIEELVLRVSLENGGSIVLTQNHHLYNGFKWTKDYIVGDKIAVINKKKNLFGTKRSVAYSKIVTIDSISYKGFVYDFEIDTHHNYVANGVLCHNTCVISAIAENFKRAGGSITQDQRALVFVKSNDLVRNFVREVSEVCTLDLYKATLTEDELRRGEEMTDEKRVLRLNKAISKTYELVTYETFLKKLPNPTIIKQRYSNRPILLDEAHFLHEQSFTKGKKEIKKEGKEGKKEKKEGSLYDAMHTFLHTVEHCRVVLFTGTPIWDKTYEIASLMNLILSKEEQLPTGRAFIKKFFIKEKLNPETRDELAAVLRGKISFLRPMMTTAKRIENGVTTPYTKYVTVYPDIMSDIQALYATQASQKIEVKEFISQGSQYEREIVGGSMYHLARDALNMVIPVAFDSEGNPEEIGYGQKAFDKYIVVHKPEKTNISYSISSPNLRKELANNLQTYSAKFHTIIEDIKNHPNEVVFIYNEQVTGLGGAIMLGLVMQLHGFRWIRSKHDISLKSTKERRFAVITSNSFTTNQPKQISDLFERANMPDNAYGDHLQIIIGSEKIALGLTIKNVRRMHVVMPHWNIPAIEQALYRGFRFGSHAALKPEERIINIFRHIAVSKNFKPPKGGAVENAVVENADVYIYNLAEDKEYRNTQIYRIAKEVAFDCAAFYKRNVLEQDVDGSRECDYQECNYECSGFDEDRINKDGLVWSYSIPQKSIDHSTYNLYFSQEEVENLTVKIAEVFRSYFSLSFPRFQKLMGVKDEEKHILLQAIEFCINNRVIIRDRYGFACYLKEDANILFLNDELSPTSNFQQSIYMETPYVTESTLFTDLIEIKELEVDKPTVREFCKTPTREKFDELFYNTKIVLLEAAFQRSLTSASLPKSLKIVLDDMGGDIYEMDDGKSIHILYTEEFKGVAYDVAAKSIKVTGLMRVYDPTIASWDYVASKEDEEKYIKEIKKVMVEQIPKINNEYGVAGWIPKKKDKKFRILLEKRETQKKQNRGKKCKDFDEWELVDIFLNKIKSLPSPSDTYANLTKSELISFIRAKNSPKIYGTYVEDLEKRDIDYLRRLLTLATLDKPGLCAELETWFRDNGILQII